MTVKEFKDKVERLGFCLDLEELDPASINEADELTETFELIFSRSEDYITITTGYTEYYEYLILSEETSNGEHYPRPGEDEFDYSELEIHYIHVSSSGLDVVLEDEDDMDRTIINVLKYIENPYLWIKTRLQYFFNEIDKVLPVIAPILNTYEFVQTESCLDITDDLFLEWAYRYNNRFTFRISMNSFTEGMWMNWGHKLIYDSLEFKNWFIKTILTTTYNNNSKIALEFERFFSNDEKWTKDSCYEIIKLLDQIHIIKERGIPNTIIKINEDIIPDKYQHLLEEYSDLINNTKG